MRRRFKNYQDAKKYFLSLDVANMASEKEFDNLLATAGMMLITFPEAEKEPQLWEDFLEKAIKIAEGKGITIIFADNAVEAYKEMRKDIGCKKAMKKILSKIFVEELSDEDLAFFLHEVYRHDECDDFMKEFCDENCRRNPDLC